MDKSRSENLDIDGLGNRQHVDIRKLSEAVSSLKCKTCKQPLSQVGGGRHSVTWFCSRCNIFHETTAGGSELRSYKKEVTQIINLSGDQ